MKSLHIRDVPEETLAGLKRWAQRHRSSLQKEVQVLLKEAARPRTTPLSQVFEALRAIPADPGFSDDLDRVNEADRPLEIRGADPAYLRALQSNASENAKDIEDIILNQLVYLYTTGFDLESATDARDRIQSETWSDRASSHVERLRELDSDDQKAFPVPPPFHPARPDAT